MLLLSLLSLLLMLPRNLHGKVPGSRYTFIDCGNQQRLERFGDLVVARSCPSALNRKSSAVIQLWDQAHLRYDGLSGKVGTWSGTTDISNWRVSFGPNLVFTLNPSPQGQIGIFPEQMHNWQWIRSTLQAYKEREGIKDNRLVKTLNGFAYTGGSSLAAHSVGNVQVVHLDASKSFNQWTARNFNASYSDAPVNVKYITDDCMTFVNREIKRGNKYELLIFDPPAFGRSDNKIWKLENDLERLVEAFPALLSDSPCGVLLSCHDVEWPPQRLGTLLAIKMKGFGGRIETGDSVLESDDESSTSRSLNKLALGGYARWTP